MQDQRSGHEYFNLAPRVVDAYFAGDTVHRLLANISLAVPYALVGLLDGMRGDRFLCRSREIRAYLQGSMGQDAASIARQPDLRAALVVSKSVL